MFLSSFVCLSVNNFMQKTSKRICMKLSGKVGNGPMNKWLNFGGRADHRLDRGIVFWIHHYWEMWKVVSTDCTARCCSAGHALAGIATATMTSCHWLMTDSHDRRTLVEVCTVLVFLVMVALCNRADHYIFMLWFVLLLLLLFFPRLISAAADWMSAILLHMVWP